MPADKANLMMYGVFHDVLQHSVNSVLSARVIPPSTIFDQLYIYIYIFIFLFLWNIPDTIMNKEYTQYVRTLMRYIYVIDRLMGLRWPGNIYPKEYCIPDKDCISIYLFSYIYTEQLNSVLSCTLYTLSRPNKMWPPINFSSKFSEY